MSKRARIPDRGDVTPALVAQRLGLSAADFEVWRPELERRGFPTPDLTTGRYCIEAVDRWRLRRHPKLFPELTGGQQAVHAETVFEERLRRLGGSR
jgi:hypothetical protein